VGLASRIRRTCLTSLAWEGGERQEKIAPFSSRGMTTSELPSGYEPDRISPSEVLVSASFSPPFKCRLLLGTSVANPVVTGVISLLLSSVEGHARTVLHNIAAIKQILHASSQQLLASSIFEQGAGLINVTAAYNALLRHIPHISLYPSRISNLPSDCPYLWPWCTQQLFLTSQPILANIAILNSMGVVGKVIRVKWRTEYSNVKTEDRTIPETHVMYVDLGEEGKHLLSDGTATILMTYSTP